jgi:hypothetical protein
MFMHTRIRAYVCVEIDVHTIDVYNACICIYKCSCIHTHSLSHIHTYIHTASYEHPVTVNDTILHTYIHTYTHTYIHTYMVHTERPFPCNSVRCATLKCMYADIGRFLYVNLCYYVCVCRHWLFFLCVNECMYVLFFLCVKACMYVCMYADIGQFPYVNSCYYVCMCAGIFCI